MKILVDKAIKAVDMETMKAQGISSLELMERAASALYRALLNHIPDKTTKILVLCGQGNNGGDGLVISRLLHEAGYRVEAVLLNYSNQYSQENQINQERLKKSGGVLRLVDDKTSLNFLSSAAILVDAVFGTGFRLPLRAPYKTLFAAVNRLSKRVIAIDMPSGLPAQGLFDEGNIAVQAAHTLCIHIPKQNLFIPEYFNYVGSWEMIDIGLSQVSIDEKTPLGWYLNEQLAKKYFKPRKPVSHKGSHGHALLMGGSLGKMGAMAIAAKACLRSGSGLTTCLVPKNGVGILQTILPEAMVLSDEEHEYLTKVPDLKPFSAVGIGPGLGQNQDTESVVEKVLRLNKKVVIDADALNILSGHPDWYDLLAGAILTPHPKEFSRLAGTASNSFDEIQKQVNFSKKHQCFIVLKNAYTRISTPDGKMYYFAGGNAGLAKGGSGDALTGIITALLAQGYLTEEAAVLGVYLHGRAATICAQYQSLESMLITDVIKCLAPVFKELSE